MTAISTASGRERFVLAGAELFTRHGFGPVGLDQVIAAAGVTKTTFYKHFASKDELIVAVLAHQHEVEMASLIEAMERRGGSDPRARMLAIFDTFDEWFGEPDFRGCMFLNAATEFPQRSDPIHQAALVHGTALEALVRETCVAAGADASTADAAASQLLLLMTGAIISRQTADHRGAAQVAKGAAELILDRMVPAAAGPARRASASGSIVAAVEGGAGHAVGREDHSGRARSR